MRRILALAALWVLLAACTDGGATEPGSTSTPSATASASGSPSASASAVAPVMPEVAREHTKAGSKAFIRHFWDVANYAQSTGNVEPMRSLVAQNCAPCQAAIEAVAEVARNGGVTTGGESRVRDIKTKRYAADDLRFDIATFTVDVAEMRVDYPDDSRDEVQAATTGRSEVTLVAQDGGGWVLTEWKALQ